MDQPLEGKKRAPATINALRYTSFWRKYFLHPKMVGNKRPCVLRQIAKKKENRFVPGLFHPASGFLSFLKIKVVGGVSYKPLYNPF